MTTVSGTTATAAPPGLTDDLAATSLALARRFAAGGTLWCCAPRWSSHAHHVAVEFVHPVIVGKRALPAVAMPHGDDLVAALRTSVRAGDVVLAIADADDAEVADALRRGPAWGVTTIWMGSGRRPAAGAADHVLWVDTDDPLAGSECFVRLYHMLWELAHVCFEHPGLLQDPGPVCTEDVCITCSDEGRLVEVVAVDDDEAVVLAEGQRERIDVSLIAPPRPGDLVLVHAGSAIGYVHGGDGAVPAEAGLGPRRGDER